MINLIFWAFFLVPWLSLFFLKNSAIRRYMPVALFATVINTIFYQIAWTYGWWKYKETLFSWDKVAQVHTVYGVFLVGTIWIFYFTFRKFWIYFLVNLITDCIYSFGFRALWKKLGITTSGGNLSPLEGIMYMTLISITLYIYQLWQEGLFGRENKIREE
ncbi:hypothetical protein [Neobacillus bataviensis]|uniref:hypothetical protein n=1 Tax=Neobacillus bataviensis TaxID=220685 RepID=UPI001CBD0A97|nr:hypothetical protein [Neobacillus bataviensis]